MPISGMIISELGRAIINFHTKFEVSMFTH